MNIPLKAGRRVFSISVLMGCLLLFSGLSLSGCGNKGPLTLPEQQKNLKKS